MISKELFLEIFPESNDGIFSQKLNGEIKATKGVAYGGTVILASYGTYYKGELSGSKPYGANIHELAHKCKEWAYDNGYEIESFYTKHTYQSSNEATGEEPEFNSIKQALIRIINTDSNSRKVLKHYYEDTEPEAIFLACEYILNNIKQ